MIGIKEATSIVRRIITGLPIEIFDDEQDTVSSVPDYELVEARPEGDCVGSREIGSANMVMAYNLLYQKLVASQWKHGGSTKHDNYLLAKKLFDESMVELQSERTIRKKPELQRKSFRIVRNENEQTN